MRRRSPKRRGGADLGEFDAGRRHLDLDPVAENPNALVGSYRIPAGTIPNVGQPAEDGKEQQCHRGGEAGGKLYSATKEVKVTVGGCGG